ncbi:hypothetical protein L1987_36279 [Smallanthus sonchifolius]|uniref:Uncharacterized protein n=1 Tax=Smallanthus sonchifolius TaxID=185202 RepID=A0ACB9HCS2_9ASTR|nr:hypothetical protein L1987_36279 [Smallanthus sonchifolius]
MFNFGFLAFSNREAVQLKERGYSIEFTRVITVFLHEFPSVQGTRDNERLDAGVPKGLQAPRIALNLVLGLLESINDDNNIFQVNNVKSIKESCFTATVVRGVGLAGRLEAYAS